MNTQSKSLLDAVRPPWAKAVIVAHCAIDKSDPQTDYFHVQDGAFHVLAWSRHTQDRFDEMRKAAATFPQTAHLGPGCGDYTAKVVLECDVQSNGYYYAGQASPWHSELYQGKYAGLPFVRKAEAEGFVATAPKPGPISFDGKLVTFRWDIWEQKIEHREKWSMGRGYYLHAGYGGGWTVEKVHLDDSAVLAAFAAGRVHVPQARNYSEDEIQAQITQLKAENARLRTLA